MDALINNTPATPFKAPVIAKGQTPAEVKKVAAEFEAMFIAEMMRPVFESMEKDPMFHGGMGEDMYQSMLVDEYGKKASAAGGIGIAEHIERQLLSLQEVQ